ncbi:hypothetical protein [Pseudonocardia xishanensis]|uniref:ARB-07466-like C-terminal domain-containing protein n=1 Tax=Pseudonocardia xishanensis TaxID=630995 RepID=A0ABP8S470_9PSEU
MRLVAVGAGAITAAALAVALGVALLLALLGGTAFDLAGAAGDADIDGLAAAAPFTGAGGGCTVDDPTTRGCLTPATHHVLDSVFATFGPPGGVLLSATCWDPHLQNPSSDHPKGRACDLFPTRAGTFPAGDDLAHGWQIANWLRANAAPLQIKYLIWQGRYWDPSTNDRDGAWGVPYTGGGIYDPTDATGGHFDHVHVSVER